MGLFPGGAPGMGPSMGHNAPPPGAQGGYSSFGVSVWTFPHPAYLPGSTPQGLLVTLKDGPLLTEFLQEET